ncbi:homeobox protein siamois-like [Eleutherodactylus coqui]|uniref:homeobox protein siamois-like n=1 Tax=Eleutherodactylus coqui TaxID=57060 RepID=UPI0034618187
MDSELDQVLCTVLSLEEDYPVLSPPPRSQECLRYQKLHYSMMIQLTVCTSCSVLGSHEEFWAGKNMGQNSLGIAAPKTDREGELRKQLKRKNSDDDEDGCKKPRGEVSDGQRMSSSARSRKKTIYSQEQTKFFQNQFQNNPYPDFVSRCRLSQITGIPEPRIQVWFQNRRARYLSRNNQIPEKKKSTTKILSDVHKKLPLIFPENTSQC